MSAWLHQALSLALAGPEPTPLATSWSPAWLLAAFFALVASSIAMAWRQAQSQYRQAMKTWSRQEHRDKEDRQKLELALQERKAAREALQTLKNQLHSHKKKHHQLQLSWKQKQQELQQQLDKAKESVKQRPAFSQEGQSQAEKPDVWGEVVPLPRRKVHVVAPIAEPAASSGALEERAPTPAPVKDPSIEALRAELATLQRQSQEQHNHQQQQIQTLQEQLQASKDMLRRLRRRSEDGRKLEFISKAQNQVLADKLKHMAKQYYDAVSELAALKGEVQPPRPKEMGSSTSESTSKGTSITTDGLEAAARPLRSRPSPPDDEIPFQPAVIVRLPNTNPSQDGLEGQQPVDQPN